ncbi:GNAT family N-acetyltransferase (plasmid) [Skermanella sp. TT6]|uniref:GNAT family N-acetyltransferase n=1 Tax=Skermanella cutis TaxID=2775420 RepID=A0ABX7BG74_9PROT|nr:GNAT family N-acetyltransferase [Skermanella sp. TT6]QQP93374.1 GNAT family N-acetyltransferase [Skermanella sp. TT6]
MKPSDGSSSFFDLSGTAVRTLDADAARDAVPDLCDVLLDCVHGGASVSFMAPLAREKAEAFWNGVAAGVARGDRALVVAEIDGRMGGGMGGGTGSRRIVGTVQMVPAPQDNQPHRADIAKLLVHSGARGRGVAAALMAEAENAARRAGRTLLVLDTVSDSAAARLYGRLGWTAAGSVPDYALYPDGRPCPTTFFYKRV